MSRFTRWVTEPRLVLLETIAAIPTLPAFAILVITLLDGEWDLFSNLMILIWMGWGTVLVGVVSISTIMRKMSRDPTLTPNKADIILVSCFALGWGLYAGSYYAPSQWARDFLEATVPLWRGVSTVSAGLLSLLVFARFVRLAVASVR